MREGFFFVLRVSLHTYSFPLFFSFSVFTSETLLGAFFSFCPFLDSSLLFIHALNLSPEAFSVVAILFLFLSFSFSRGLFQGHPRRGASMKQPTGWIKIFFLKNNTNSGWKERKYKHGFRSAKRKKVKFSAFGHSILLTHLWSSSSLLNVSFLTPLHPPTALALRSELWMSDSLLWSPTPDSQRPSSFLPVSQVCGVLGRRSRAKDRAVLPFDIWLHILVILFYPHVC